jgi:hypothetical protein
MQTTRKLSLFSLGTLVVAGASMMVVVASFIAPQPAAYAQLIDKDSGASGFAPAEEPLAPGWDPSGVEGDAPGQLAEIPPTCIECAEEIAPGQLGQEAGIIGPD